MRVYVSQNFEDTLKAKSQQAEQVLPEGQFRFLLLHLESTEQGRHLRATRRRKKAQRGAAPGLGRE